MSTRNSFSFVASFVLIGVFAPMQPLTARPPAASASTPAETSSATKPLFRSIASKGAGVHVTQVADPSPTASLTLVDLNAETPAIDEFVEADAGFIDVQVSGSPGLAQARFGGSVLVAPEQSAVDLGQDPTPDTVFDLGAGTVFGLVNVSPDVNGSAAGYRLIVDISSATSFDIDLFLGNDFDGDSRPTDFEVLCSSVTETAVEHCEIDIPDTGSPQTYWWLVQNFAGSGGLDTVDISIALVPLAASADGIVASGPGQVDPGVDFNFRLGWDDPSFKLGQVRLGFVTIESAPGEVVARVPVRLERDLGFSVPRALANGVDRPLTTDIFEIMDQVFFDVPPNAREVTFTATGMAQVDLYAAPAPAPAPGENRTTIDPAPIFTAAPFSVENNDDFKQIVVSGDALTPGRWYLTTVTHLSNEVPQDIVLRAEVTQADPRPALRAGHYFDARRVGSSSGLFLDFAGTQWFGVWYAYLEDGSPTWYFVQGDAPIGDAASFRGDLLRVSWDGDQAHRVTVGEMLITPTGEESFDLSFMLDGQTGSEPMVRLGAGGCLNFAGADLDVSGHWFTFARSGFGYSVQIDAGKTRDPLNPDAKDQEVVASYLYDREGFPRWLFGQVPFDAAQSVPLRQFRDGPCPTCDFAATPAFEELPVVGSLARTYVQNDIADIGVTANFVAPLFGLWEEALPVESLSARKLCQ